MLTETFNRQYRNIYLVDSRDWFATCKENYDVQQDLVLTFDFALHAEITQLGGQVAYVDHLIDPAIMQDNNYRTYEFFRRWHYDATGNDIFIHRGIPFGFALRLEIWNDLLFYVRARLCLKALNFLQYQTLYLGSDVLASVLTDMGLSFQMLSSSATTSQAAYFFPIFRWMNERVRSTRWKHRFRDAMTAVLGTMKSWLDYWRRANKSIFIQVYHPTRDIYHSLQKDTSIRIVQGNFSSPKSLRGFMSEHVIPIWPSAWYFSGLEKEHLAKLDAQFASQLVLSDGQDITAELLQLIKSRLAGGRIAHTLNELHWVMRYMDRHPLDLVVLVGNMGPVATVLHCVAQQRQVPSYLIINGFLGKAYQDESKYASLINAYSESIRTNYFQNQDNVVCLGDPRMDAYANLVPKSLNRACPTITIGASGFNPTDLNSYLAIEFDFMYDVLSALLLIYRNVVALKVVIKVRSNGYLTQYQQFVAEFFSDLPCEIHDATPMRELLEKTDFYISTYSQTLFEASCLGIPAVYYKKDNEVTDAPFDGQYELVTALSSNDLFFYISEFISGNDSRFIEFSKISAMEKYIGSIDGNNRQGNLNQIYTLLGLSREIEKVTSCSN